MPSLATRSDGWRLVTQKSRGGLDRFPGYQAERPGSVAELPIFSSGMLLLLYMQSYEHFANASLSCRGGCSCEGFVRGTDPLRATSEPDARALTVLRSNGTALQRIRRLLGAADDDDASRRREGCVLRITTSGSGIFKLMGIINVQLDNPMQANSHQCLSSYWRAAEILPSQRATLPQKVSRIAFGYERSLFDAPKKPRRPITA